MSLLEFYGTECPHCIKMEPLIGRLEKEEGIKIERFEIWHDDENRKKFDEYDKGDCGGVPFFINTETNGKICGDVSYEDLKAWVLGSKA